MSTAAESKRVRTMKARAGECLHCRAATGGFAYCAECRARRAVKMKAYHKRRGRRMG